MKILYIGTVASDKTMSNIYKYCKDRKPTMSGIVFDRNIATELAQQCETEAISMIVAPSFPSCRKIFIGNKAENINGLEVKYISYVNFPGLKYLIFELKLLFRVLKWNIKNKSDSKAIVLAANYIFFNRPASFMKKKFNTKVYSIFTDLPEFEMSYSNKTSNFKKRMLSFCQRNDQKRNEKLDGYIFLTEAMDEKINRKRKPSIIIEGVIGDVVSDEGEIVKKNAIMYAGTLNEKFGIKNLLSAFMGIKNDTLELWLYGYGDYDEKIREVAKVDDRIKFFGQRERKEILKAERQARVLVNPRQNKDEFTKYSFPSKTMEYLASGTPVLMYKLDGIPKEYDNYIYYVDGNNVDDLRRMIEKLIDKPQSELDGFGEKARKWVLKNKNVGSQTEKIVELINAHE